jgi:regulator of sirC expression with transglutaminase-like and TPR domain
MSKVPYIHPAEARRQFREFAETDFGNDELARGALLIALEDYRQLDVDEYIEKLDELAARVERRCVAGEPAIFRLGHLHSELFDRDQYRGDTTSYYEPRNAYLNEVIDRKLGIPITLSIVFIHVANRIGLNASGVGLPGHYIVKVRFELNEVYVDPFHGGSTLTMGEIAELLGQISAGQIRLSAEHLRAWSARQTLVRVLANLESMWNQAGDGRKARAAAERIALLQP